MDPRAATWRVFCALRPPPAAVADLLEALRALPTAGRAPDPSRWHVTLAFFGELEPGALPGLVRQVGSAVDAAPAPRLALVAPDRATRRLPVLAMGLRGDLDELATLALACGHAGSYLPHLTIGRRGPAAATVPAGYAGPVWRASEVLVVRSHLAGVTTHEVLARLAFSRRRRS